MCEYSGELIGEKEAKRREEQYSEDPSVGCYMYFFIHKTSKWWYVLVAEMKVNRGNWPISTGQFHNHLTYVCSSQVKC